MTIHEKNLQLLYENPEAPLALDTETLGLRHFDKTIGVSYAALINDEPVSGYVATGHLVGDNDSEETIAQLLYVMSQPRPLIFANAQFDLLKIEQLGLRLDEHELFDVSVMAHLVDENLPYQGKSLAALSQLYLGEQAKVEEFDHIVEYRAEGGKIGVRQKYRKEDTLLWQKKNGWPDTTPEMLAPYATADAEVTYRVWLALASHPEWCILPQEVIDEKQALIRVLLDMRRQGVLIDPELAQKYIAIGEIEMEKIVAELGLNPGSRNDLEELFLNRMKLPVLKRTPKKQPSFDKEVMAKYDLLLEKQDSKEAKLVKTYRGWQTAVGLAYRPYLELVDHDGRLRTSYKMHGTVTGRFSASEPNLQQIPKETDKPWNGKVKECFIPEDGYVLLNADFSQLELRLATCYANEEKLMEVFIQGRDIFTEMGLQLGMARQDTKTLVYSMQYGAGINRIMGAFGVTRERAQGIRDNYFATYPRFKALSDMYSNRARNAGKVRLLSGRYRHFPYPEDEDYKAMNSVIQGGAADIVERVMIRVHKELHNNDNRMLLQVHDSITFETRLERVEEYIPRIHSVMEDVVGTTGIADLGVIPFAVDVGFWTESEEDRFKQWKVAA